MTSFKETIEEQILKIKHLQDNNCKLVKEKEYLAGENNIMSEINKKLEKELCEKSAELVVYNFSTYCFSFIFILVLKVLTTHNCYKTQLKVEM